MAKIYQAFDLYPKTQEKVDKKKKAVQGRSEKLIKELEKKGYVVLFSAAGLEDIPKSIIVVAQSKKKQNTMMEDFHNVASGLGLHFKDGNLYFKPN